MLSLTKSIKLIPNTDYTLLIGDGCGQCNPEKVLYIGSLEGKHPYFGTYYVFLRDFNQKKRYTICKPSLRYFMDSLTLQFNPENWGAAPSIKSAIKELYKKPQFRWNSEVPVKIDLEEYQNEPVRSNDFANIKLKK